ncbi:uncharacterized protein LOC107479488 [Arachis duranensis]|uniref:Uncharacterized protein LOC107479488 n=1 Tax=Arachis duranensis TaxID=130453 RepID=A0A6P4CPW3_ARADU|nr:uncharacterized protein LOC107479488 [Arachis duranensis]
MKAKVPKDFKAPDMTLYDGISHPSYHLSNFRSRMYLTDASNKIRCKVFPTTLTKTAIKWFDNLPPRSITSFDNLTKKFLARFSIQKDKTKHAPRLLGIKEGDREILCSYMERFNKACLNIHNLPTEAAIMGLINGLRDRPFSHSISMKHPTSLNDVKEQAEKYINMEKNSRLGETSKTEFSYPPRDKDKESTKKEDQPTDKPRKYHNYIPLRVSLMDVYQEICNIEKIPPPCPIKHKRGESLMEYCEYHQIYGHATNECYDLKNVIEKLAREGRLDRFLANRADEPKKRRDEEDRRAERPPRTPERHVHMINRGFAGGGIFVFTGGGISKSSRKRHLKEVYLVGEGDRSPDLPTITFTQEDAAGIIPRHDDPVVVTIILANGNLHRTLVDQGSSTDILFKSAFDMLDLQEKELRAYPNILFGLGDAPIQPVGYIPLHTTFGK